MEEGSAVVRKRERMKERCVGMNKKYGRERRRERKSIFMWHEVLKRGSNGNEKGVN